MPAHITHEVFAYEVFRIALGTQSLTPFHVFGAQGPDFFLHNHRTKPTGLIFGKLLHSEGYGRYVGKLISSGLKRDCTFDSPLGAYTAAFATHAVLDRITHPYINYHAGWVVPYDPRSEKFKHCHVFYERILDVFVLRIRTGNSIEGYDFFSHVYCGEMMPEFLAEPITDALAEAYPDYTNRKKILKQTENAYIDTMRYFARTNPPNRERVRKEYIEEYGTSRPPGRLLALLHPEKLPELDYLNVQHREWNDPGDPENKRTGSFLDLYEKAIETAAPVVRAVARGFGGEISPDEVSRILGNENLSDGRPRKAIRKLKHVSPLPLQDVLASIYMQ
jgi:hypothetical protein